MTTARSGAATVSRELPGGWAVLESLPDPAWLARPDGHVTHVNGPWAARTGQAAAAAAGWGWAEALHPEERPALLAAWHAALRAGTPMDGQGRLRRAGGGYGRVALRGRPVRREDGSVGWWVGTVAELPGEGAGSAPADAAARRDAVVAGVSRVLAESMLDLPGVLEGLTRSVGRALGDGCEAWLVGPDGVGLELAALHHADPLVEARARRGAAGRGWRADRGLAERLMGGEAVMWSVVGGAEPAGPYPADGQAAFGRVWPPTWVAVPLRVGSRRIGVLAAWRDGAGRPYELADVELLEELAERGGLAVEGARRYAEVQWAVRRRDEFLSLAAHELKTPITSLRGYAQLVVRRLRRPEGLDPATVESALAEVDRQSRRLTGLLDDLLEASRAETGRLVLQQEAVDLGLVVERLVERLRSMHPERRLELRVGGPVPAWLDRRRLEGVVARLVDNGVKFSPPEAPVEIEVGMAEGQARLAVRDHGAGVAEAERDRIFERPYRVQDEEHSGGLGLGLFVSRRVVELHGGSLEVESAEGGGARFVVRLPVPSGGEGV